AHQGEVPIEAALDKEDLDEEELGEEGTFDEPIQVEVLDRWRELDEQGAREAEELEEEVVLMPQTSPPTPVAPVSLVPPVPLGSGSSGLTGEPPPGISLRAARIDGLSKEWLEGLERTGVGTLEELIEAPELGLARRSGIAYTQILRLQFLARRVAARGAPGASPAPAAAQPAAEQRLDAAGPFA
ncbi:MAG: hypothetical protein O7B99_04395, partial [Planctomycetota bacterium]|nr:hypothetical protein [Planctomycetota bacterium]